MFGRSPEPQTNTATAEPPFSYHRPWEDVPADERAAERTMRTVRMLRRVRLDENTVAEVGSVQHFPHPFALSLVRDFRAEPVR